MTTQAMQAPVTGPHAETIRRAYLLAGMLGRLDLSEALADVCASPLPPSGDDPSYESARAQRRQDAAVLRVLLRAQRDLERECGVAPRPPRGVEVAR